MDGQVPVPAPVHAYPAFYAYRSAYGIEHLAIAIGADMCILGRVHAGMLDVEVYQEPLKPEHHDLVAAPDTADVWRALTTDGVCWEEDIMGLEIYDNELDKAEEVWQALQRVWPDLQHIVICSAADRSPVEYPLEVD
jgi:hypothetical protein